MRDSLAIRCRPNMCPESRRSRAVRSVTVCRTMSSTVFDFCFGLGVPALVYWLLSQSFRGFGSSEAILLSVPLLFLLVWLSLSELCPRPALVGGVRLASSVACFALFFCSLLFFLDAPWLPVFPFLTGCVYLRNGALARQLAGVRNIPAPPQWSSHVQRSAHGG